MRRITAILALTVLLAACASSGDATSAGAGEMYYSPDELAAPAPMDQAAATRDIDIVFETVDGRKVIRQASLELHASDTRAAFDRIVQLTESKGGFVASAEVQPTIEGKQPTVSMTVRIPASELNSTMQLIKDGADEVVSEWQTAEDVSEQFVDLEARLTNLEAFEVELRALLEEVRLQPDADPEKLLRVFNELAAVRGQIEQIQGQINHLSQLTELATLQVYVAQTPSALPLVAEPWAPLEAAKDAARNLVAALQNIANWVIGFIIYTLPVLILVLTVPVLVGLYVYRRWWKNRPTPPAAPLEA